MPREIEYSYVKALKSAAFEIVEKAQEFVGNIDCLCDMTVSIKLSPDEAVIIDVDKQYISMKSTNIILEDRD